MDDFKGCIIRNFSVAIYYRNVMLSTQDYYYFAQFSGKIYSHIKESRDCYNFRRLCGGWIRYIEWKDIPVFCVYGRAFFEYLANTYVLLCVYF